MWCSLPMLSEPYPLLAQTGHTELVLQETLIRYLGKNHRANLPMPRLSYDLSQMHDHQQLQHGEQVLLYMSH